MSPQFLKLSVVFVVIAAVTAVSAFIGYTSEIERQKRERGIRISPAHALSPEVSRDTWSTSR